MVNQIWFPSKYISQKLMHSSSDEHPMPYRPTQRNTVHGRTHADSQDSISTVRWHFSDCFFCHAWHHAHLYMAILSQYIFLISLRNDLHHQFHLYYIITPINTRLCVSRQLQWFAKSKRCQTRHSSCVHTRYPFERVHHTSYHCVRWFATYR